MIAEPGPKGFFSYLWRDLRFNIRSHCTPGSENEFVDVETFSDDVLKFRRKLRSLLLLLMLEVLPLTLLLLKMKLLLNLLGSWRCLFRGEKIVLKIFP
jgi:hypothetical protein